MITIEGQKYEIIGDNRFRNTKTHKIVNGNHRFKHLNLGDDNKIEGCQINTTYFQINFFDISLSWKTRNNNKIFVDLGTHNDLRYSRINNTYYTINILRAFD